MRFVVSLIMQIIRRAVEYHQSRLVISGTNILFIKIFYYRIVCFVYTCSLQYQNYFMLQFSAPWIATFKLTSYIMVFTRHNQNIFCFLLGLDPVYRVKVCQIVCKRGRTMVREPCCRGLIVSTSLSAAVVPLSIVVFSIACSCTLVSTHYLGVNSYGFSFPNQMFQQPISE